METPQQALERKNVSGSSKVRDCIEIYGIQLFYFFRIHLNCNIPTTPTGQRVPTRNGANVFFRHIN
jgi:hypothetical protein